MDTDPDQLVRRLWRLRERLSSPMSSIPYESSGAVLAETCVRCGHGSHRKAASGVESCARCGTEWILIEGRVAKGSSKHRRHINAVAERSEEFGWVVAAICTAIPDEVQRTLYEYHLDPSGGGARYAISAARVRGVVEGPFPEHRFWKELRQAREQLGAWLWMKSMRGEAA